jgi:excisionase family DNA binding protein
MSQPDLLTVKEAAAGLRCHPQTLWKKIRRGELAGVVKHGRIIRIERAALYARVSASKRT